MDAQNQTTTPANASVDQDKLMGVLAYLWVLVFIPLLASKSENVKFHTNQGLWLLIGDVASFVISWIPLVGWLVSCVYLIVRIVYTVLGIVNVLNGERKPLPGLASLPVLVK